MKIFTITCLRDFDLLVLQCKSVRKYLNVDEFNIVINENDDQVKKFRKLYKEHIQPIFQDLIKVNLIKKSFFIKIITPSFFLEFCSRILFRLNFDSQ